MEKHGSFSEVFLALTYGLTDALDSWLRGIIKL